MTVDTMTDVAPNFGSSETYPSAGAMIGPAWAAAWRLLADGPQGPDVLAGAMMSAGGVQRKTADNLLSKAKASGHIEPEYRWTGSPRRRHLVSYRRTR